MKGYELMEANQVINRTRRAFPFVLSVALMCFLTLAKMGAQVTTADIVGTVTDPSGAAVVTGTATATSLATGEVKKVNLSGTGTFEFTLMQVGSYKVGVQASGFKGYVTQVTLAAGDRARVTAALTLGAAAETVTVESTTPALQTDDATIGTLITSEATQDLPLNGRNVTNLVTLAAGVTGGLGNAMNSGTRPDDRRMSSSFAANGQSDEINNNMIDGMDNNERFIGSVGVRPSIDAIEEVKVLTNLYTAEVSRSGGGVVDLITKSGGNQFHGTLYEFVRNDKFDAKNFFAAPGPPPELRQNQFGGSVGGPIMKDKAFFFFDVEDFRLVKGVTALSSVPTLYEEQNPGDFSDLGTGCTNLTKKEGWTPGPIGLNYFKLYPAPNMNVTPTGVGCAAPLNNYNFTGGNTQFIKTYDAKVDYRFSPRDSMYARYTYNDTNVYIPGTFPVVNGVNPGGGVWGAAGGSSFAGPATDTEHSAALDYNHLLSNNLILDLKAQFMRLQNESGTVNGGKETSTAFGFPCTATSCVNLPGDSPSSGLMAWSSYGGGPYGALGDGAYTPLLDQNNTFQYVGSLSWLKGPHAIKAGFSVIRRHAAETQSPFPRGFMDDYGDLTGNQLGDLLSDYTSEVQRSYTLVIADFRSWELGYYLQDDWRLKPNLTLNLGARYDIYTPFTSANYGFSNFDPGIGLLYGPGLPGAQQSNSTAGVQTDYSNLAPRLGFDWTVKPSWVVRGGFGITFFPENTASGSFMRNAPYSFSYHCGAAVATNAGGCGSYGPGGDGPTALGYYFDTGLPIPTLNMALATNPVNYAGTSIQQTVFGYRNAFLQQYSLNVEKDFRGNVFTLAYVGNHGGRLVTDSINANELPIPVSEGGTFPYANFTYNGASYLNGVNIAIRDTVLKSLYNAAQFSVERRMRNGLAFNVNYTWAHNLTNSEDIDEGSGTGSCYGACQMDNGTGKAVTINSFYQYDYGNADIDTRQRMALNLSYDLPFGKGLTGPGALAIKGWSMNAIYYAQTGNPITVANPNGSISNIGQGSDRPNQVKPSGAGFHKGINSWYDTTQFQLQGQNLLGNEMRNQVYGPGTQAVSFSIFKTFPIWEAVKLQFRAEAFNLMNTPTFSNPGGTLGYSTYTPGAIAVQGANGAGVINGTPAAASPRQIQLALKLIF